MANLGHDPVSANPVSSLTSSNQPFNNSGQLPPNSGTQKARLGAVDVYPNLLLTTLAALAILPPGQQLSASTPTNYAKYQVQVDQPVQHPLTLGFNPQPQILGRLDWPAPPPKSPVYVDQPLFHPLTLGMNPQPQVRQLDPSAPAVVRAVQVDVYPNLSVTTLAAAAVQNPFKPLDTTQLQPKYQVFVDQVINRLVLGYNPQPQIQRLDQSAPPPKTPVYVDQPTFHPLTLGMNPQPQVQRLDQSAPPPKYQVFIDQPTFHPLTLGMNPQPVVQQLSSAAPLKQSAVQIDVYPNLLATTLGQPPAVPFTPIDSLQFQAKYQVVIDLPTNTLVLGYPPPPPDVIVPPPAGGGLLPGWLGEHSELGKGMGPYKRPGQVFGEPPVLSPYMGSQRAPRARPPNLQQLPLALEPVAEPQVLNFEIEIAMLLAMDEAHKPAGVLIRGPLTVTLIRRV